MAYIGNEPADRFTSIPTVQQFNGDASTTAFTLNRAVGSDQDLLVSVDGVIQDTAAYAVSNGTTLTFSAAPSQGTANIFVNHLGLTIGSVVHPASSALAATTGTFSADVTFADGADIITASAGTSNFRAGVNAGNSIQSGGNQNTVVGDEAGTALTTGDDNTFIGYAAGDATTTSTDNVAVGHDAFTANSTGGDNVAVGANALMTNTTADANTAVGYQALKDNTEGHSNVAVGKNALKVNTTAHNNTAVGFQSMLATTTGDTNSAFGKDALKTCTTGTNNSAIGTRSLQLLTSAANCIAVGDLAGAAITTGSGNTFIGVSAGDSCTDSINCVAIGINALGGADADHSNVAVGQLTLNTCTGDSNTAVGDRAGSDVTSGDNNLFLGQDAGRTGAPGGSITTANNTIVLGDGNIANAHIQVDWTVASDKRDKTDVEPVKMGLDFVKELEPVTYRWDKRSKYVDESDDTVDLNDVVHDGTHKEDWSDIGFLAQDVEVLEEKYGHKITDKTNLTTNLSEDGKQYGIQYSKFVPILVKAIQELSKKNDALETKNDALEARIKTLEDA